MRRVLAAAIFAGLLAALVSAAVASACSCIELTPKAVKKADARVIARLERVDVVPVVPVDPTRPIPGSQEADFTYTVLEALGRGRPLVAGSTMTIHSNTGGASCGLPSGIGTSYGMVLSFEGGRWTSSLCTTTSPQRLRKLVKQSKRKTPRPD